MKILTKSNIICLFLVLILSIGYIVYFYNVGHLVKLPVKIDNQNMPVKLNNNEILFLGGFDGNNHNVKISTKKYNIDNKRLDDLGVFMNYPRASYLAIDLDEDNVLIAGGYCLDDKIKNCDKIVEIFNIKEHKFRLIENSLYDITSDSSHIVKLQNNKYFIFSNENAQIFDYKTEKFTVAGKEIKYKRKYDNDVSLERTRNTFNVYTPAFGYEFEVTGLQDGNVLIIGANQNAHNAEIYDINKNLFYGIEDYNFTTPLGKATLLPDGTVLIVGGYHTQGYVNLFNPKNNKFEFVGTYNPGFRGASSIMLKNGDVLFVNGIVETSIFGGKYLEKSIYNVKKKKFYNTSYTNKNRYKTYLFDMDKNGIFIFGYLDGYPRLFKY